MGTFDLAQRLPIQAPVNGEEKIVVSVRLRPLNEKEIARNDVSDWECINENTILHINSLSASERTMYPSSYTFDSVFGPECSTKIVYEEGAKAVALSVVSGINSSVFAYGQTSSGKTYTMSGVTEYTVADIFQYIESHNERTFILKFSAIEIYNECVRDLLSSDPTPLRLLDDPEKGTVVEKLIEETITGWNHFKELLGICEAQRQIGETNLNEASSRSHQILRLAVESVANGLSGNGIENSSILAASVNFVDLAGSERASQSLSAGTRLKEGCHINRSLLTLGTVIRKLSKGRSYHIPYRDSKLTRILQSSLGGNARTAIICTLSPARVHVEQSRNTLLFASCAKEVTTNAQVNVMVSDKALVKQLQKELARLENQLRGSGLSSVDQSLLKSLQEKDRQIEKLTQQVAELTLQLDNARTEIETLSRTPHNAESETISQYPKLRVRSSWGSDQSYSSLEDPQSLDIGFISLDASRNSDGGSLSNSEDNFVTLDVYSEQHLVANYPQPSPDIGGNQLPDETENSSTEICSFSCKEVQCIKVEEPSIKSSHNRSFLHDALDSPERSIIVESSPAVNTISSGYCHQNFQSMHSPEILRSWKVEDSSSISSYPKKKRTKSCMARISDKFPEDLPETGESNDSPLQFKFDKDLDGTVEDFQPKLSSEVKIVCEESDDRLEMNLAEDAIAAVDQLPRSSESTSTNLRSLKDVGLDPIIVSRKDVGLDPILDDLPAISEWASEFEKLQKEIIKLWNDCNVSLVHRSYFFLLFPGDSSDSLYMEVESRRLTFLRESISRGSTTLVNGHAFTLTSSKKSLDQERYMLSREMSKKLGGEERENLFLKWGIPLHSTQRRLQLAHKLWTDTTDMEHISESAALVAKLVGFEEPNQALRELFGLLNFAPKQSRWKKAPLWRRSVKTLL